MSDRAADLYLDLLKRVLTRELFLDEEATETVDVRFTDYRRKPYAPIRRLLDRKGLRLIATSKVDRATRELGRDWPRTADTMIGLRRLENLQHCVRAVIHDGVPGDLVETGVWRGGASIFMRATLAAYGDDTRTVWLADSFEGLPPPDPRYPADSGLDLSGIPYLAVTLEEVQERFARYGLLDDKVRFLKGWFQDTLHSAPIDRIAVLRLDGDLYQSTIDALDALYPRLTLGGFLIVDDYGTIPACRTAVEHFRTEHGIDERIVDIDGSGIYWRRTR